MPEPNNLWDIFSARASLTSVVEYILVGRVVLWMRVGWVRSLVFVGLNFAVALDWLWDGPFRWAVPAYAGFVTVQWLSIRRRWGATPARFVPILFPLAALAFAETRPAPIVLGFSYLAFRMAHAAYEIHAGKAARPELLDYLAHCLFLPTLMLGPISPLSRFQASFGRPGIPLTSLWQGVLRIVVGLVKVRFLAMLCRRLSFSVLWTDGYLHGPEDFAISCVASLLYLYFNFSGFCDVAIAMAALVGVDVKENFDSPFTSRNLREYWTRWHVTLGDVANALVFTPLSQRLVRKAGRTYASFAIVAGVMATFCAIGLWHGFAWNFLCFGLANGVGVSVAYLFEAWMRRRPSAVRTAFRDNAAVRAAACGLTFLYAAGTMFFFENDVKAMTQILSDLRFEAPAGGRR